MAFAHVHHFEELALEVRKLYKRLYKVAAGEELPDVGS